MTDETDDDAVETVGSDLEDGILHEEVSPPVDNKGRTKEEVAREIEKTYQRALDNPRSKYAGPYAEARARELKRRAIREAEVIVKRGPRLLWPIEDPDDLKGKQDKEDPVEKNKRKALEDLEESEEERVKRENLATASFRSSMESIENLFESAILSAEKKLFRFLLETSLSQKRVHARRAVGFLSDIQKYLERKGSRNSSEEEFIRRKCKASGKNGEFRPSLIRKTKKWNSFIREVLDLTGLAREIHGPSLPNRGEMAKQVKSEILSEIRSTINQSWRELHDTKPRSSLAPFVRELRRCFKSIGKDGIEDMMKKPRKEWNKEQESFFKDISAVIQLFQNRYPSPPIRKLRFQLRFLREALEGKRKHSLKDREYNPETKVPELIRALNAFARPPKKAKSPGSTDGVDQRQKKSTGKAG